MAALLLVAVAWPAQAQMYKCTNERGVVQYTDKPSAGCKEVDIRSSPPISGALQSPSEDLARQEAEFRKRQIDREAGELEERKSQLDRCARMGTMCPERRAEIVGLGLKSIAAGTLATCFTAASVALIL